MKINNNIQNKYSPSYKGIWNNKVLLKSLETISEHGTSFVAATTFAMSTGIRPIAISLTPNTDKKNKQYAATNSIASGLIKFAMVESIALPIENAIKNIDKNPEKYLQEKTIDNLKDSAKTLSESRSYKFGTQILKQSSSLITAIPKSVLTVALIPILADKLFNKKKEEKENKTTECICNNYDPIFAPIIENKKTSTPSFKGSITNQLSKGISKIINNNSFQNITKKYTKKDADITRNLSMASDLLLTASFIHRTKKDKKIEKERKTPLIANNVISTSISLIGGYSLDKFIKKNTDKFIKKFSEINKNDPKLNKYIEGINIVRPTLIFAGIYYGILPIFSTYFADKTTKLKTE